MDEPPDERPPAGAPRTSCLTIRPPGPEPVSEVNATPFSWAIFLARGEALTRSPLGAGAVDAEDGAVAGVVLVSSFLAEGSPFASLAAGVAGFAGADSSI